MKWCLSSLWWTLDFRLPNPETSSQTHLQIYASSATILDHVELIVNSNHTFTG